MEGQEIGVMMIVMEMMMKKFDVVVLMMELEEKK